MEQIHRVTVDTISFCWTLLRALTAFGLWRSQRKWVSRGCLKYLPKCSMFLRVEISQLLPMVKRDYRGMLQNVNAVRNALRNTMKCRVWFDVENFQLLLKLTQFAFRKHKKASEEFKNDTMCGVSKKYDEVRSLVARHHVQNFHQTYRTFCGVCVEQLKL